MIVLRLSSWYAYLLSCCTGVIDIAEPERVSYICARAALLQALFDDGCAQFAVRHVRHIATYARPTVTAFTGSKASASSAGAVGLRVPSLTAFMTAKFSQGGVEPCSPCSQ